MPCVITAGYIIDCRENVGGVKAIFIAEFGNMTVNEVSGVVTGITKVTGKRFYKFEVPRATASTTNNATASEENGSLFFTHQVIFPLNRRDATTRNIITTLAKAKLIAVALGNDGSYRMFGKGQGLYLASTEGGSGTAMGDRNGYNITLSGMETEDFLEVSSAIGLALETAG